MLASWKIKYQEICGENRRWLIFLNRSFRGAAISLVVLFSPIYIYKALLVLTGESRLALGGVFGYYFVVYFFKYLANVFSEELSRRWGLKKQMYIGLAFSAASLLALYGSLENLVYLGMASVFWGFSTGFFWFGSHGMLLKSSDKFSFGSNWGIGDGVNVAFSMLIPLLGGFLVSRWDYGALFGVAVMFIAIAFLLILPIEEQKTKVDTNMGEIFRLFFHRPRAFLAYAGSAGAGVVYAFVLPLYIFLILQEELFLGGFFSLSAVVVAVVSLAVGRMSDRGRKRQLVRFGSLFQSMIWIFRSLTRAVGFLFFLDVAEQVTNRMVTIPLGAGSYQKAVEDHSTGRAMLFREQAITLGGLAVFLLTALWVGSGGNLEAIFGLAAFLSLWPLLESGQKGTK